MKKIITLALLAAMMLTMIVVGTSAAAWDGTTATAFTGTGTAEDPYVIASAENLKYLEQQVFASNSFEGKYFVQTADIDLGNKEWMPIGNLGKPFSGVYNGQGHKITGFSMTESKVLMGLFGHITATNDTEAGIANLTLEGNITVEESKQESYIGGLSATIYKNNQALVAKEIYIINVTVDVDINVKKSAFQDRVGGFAGWFYSATVENCVNNGDVFASSTLETRVGGFYGQGSRLTMTNCVNNGNISSTGAGNVDVAGFGAGVTDCSTAGAKRTLFTNCVNNGNITGVSTGKTHQVRAGGFFGSPYAYAGGFEADIKNCANNGKISATLPTKEEGYTGSGYPYAGGIAATLSYADFTIQNSVNTAEIVSVGGNGVRPGGIIGVMNKPGEATLYIKDCVTVGSLSAYIQNGKEGCVANAEQAVADAAAKTIEDAIVPSVVRIAGFPTGYVAPPAPETTTAAPAETTAAPAETTAAPSTPSTPSTPNTGDVTSVILLALVAACAGAVITIKKTK